ncbi:MAG: hypothetical protein ACT4PW_06220 [Acidimicrobiia bacterium]
MTAVEYLDGSPLSYMTVRALDLLRRLRAVVDVVPVTTRSLAQYRRVELFHGPLTPTYAVAANGGHLLHDGEPDLGWYESVRAAVARSCADAATVADHLAEFGRAWAHRARVADGLFVYSVVDRAAIPARDLRQLDDWLAASGWELSVQGRKLYAVPGPLGKWRAVEEVVRRTGATVVVAAGDSLLDRDMLDRADFSLRPPHGELATARYGCDVVTSSGGILAAEELLEAVLDHLDGRAVPPLRVELQR